jgi:AcrR family transcriptional regulator
VEHSATNDGGGLRERKRAATRRSITAAARALTAAHGVNGFTVEQLCGQVGISRRTFFNYFPAKEDAILGQPGDDIPDDLAEAFVAGGPGHPADGISATLLADFAELAAGILDRMAISREEVLALKQAVMTEPALLDRARRGSQDRRNVHAGLISARENLPPGDPRVGMTCDVLELLLKRSNEEFFAPGNTRSFRDVASSQLGDLRTVVCPA